MSEDVTLYYDFVSPYSYMAFTQIKGLEERTGAKVHLRPVAVGAVMKRTGNVPTSITCEAKRNYAAQDLGRWAMRYGVPIKPNPRFTEVDMRPLLLGAIAAEQLGRQRPYAAAVFRGVWVDQVQFETDEELRTVLEKGGVGGPDEIMETRKLVEEEAKRLVDEAVEAGAFGVPTFVHDGQLYFGNDRIAFLEQALTA
jgi:2-hydroxychromene-2-carboxylate isomerase